MCSSLTQRPLKGSVIDKAEVDVTEERFDSDKPLDIKGILSSSALTGFVRYYYLFTEEVVDELFSSDAFSKGMMSATLISSGKLSLLGEDALVGNISTLSSILV